MWTARDPLVTFPQRLRDEGIADDALLADIEREVRDEVEAAAVRALAGTKPEPDRVRKFSYADESVLSRDGSVPWLS
jgi:TPP-dependent pyruvate/acetoin dehydrogenase alpha subunit